MISSTFIFKIKDLCIKEKEKKSECKYEYENYSKTNKVGLVLIKLHWTIMWSLQGMTTNKFVSNEYKIIEYCLSYILQVVTAWYT